ncbi:hypothetical protein DFH06DRAFT_1393225 [Mycena polygramma]|nr:hypothetical protein DFH06DRAFT_1393225 [Mycena polygramma]
MPLRLAQTPRHLFVARTRRLFRPPRAVTVGCRVYLCGAPVRAFPRTARHRPRRASHHLHWPRTARMMSGLECGGHAAAELHAACRDLRTLAVSNGAGLQPAPRTLLTDTKSFVICESGALLSRPTSIPPPRAPRVHPARYRTRAAVAVLPLLLLQLPLDFELLCMSNLPPPHARIPRRTSACAPAFTGVRFLLRTSYASSTYICSNVGARGSGWRWRAATAGSVPRAGNMLSSPSIVFAEASKERASLSRRFVALHEIVRLEITVVTRAHRPSLGRRVRLRQVPLSRFLDPRRHARHPHRRSPPYPPSPLHLTTAGSMQDEDETVRYDDTLPAKAVGDAEESSAQRTSFPTVWRALPTPSARQIPHHVVFVPHRSLTKSPHFTLSALPVPSSSKARWRRQENVSLRGVTCSRALALPERLRARAVRHHVKQAVMEHNALAHKRQVNSGVLGGSWWVWE